MAEFQINYNVHIGAGELENLGVYAKDLGKKACVLMDKFFRGGKFEEKVASLLKENEVDCVFFSDFNPDPDCTEVDKCVEVINANNCDLVIAFGGGSCIDAAKASAVVAKHGGLCWEYCAQALPDGTIGCPKAVTKGKLPLIAIPTTSGTGSEMSKGAVISNHEKKVKSGVSHPCMVPDISLIDPLLTVDLPPEQTAYTGIDAFCHAFESYMLSTSSNLSEATALQAIRLVGKSLVKAVKDGKDIQARTDMANASNLAGYNILLTNTTVGHLIGQQLSGLFKMSHGQTLAVTLEAIINWTYPCGKERLADVAVALRPEIGALSVDEQAKALSGIITDIKEQCGINTRLSDFGVTEADIPKVMEYLDKNLGFDHPIWHTHVKVPKKDDFIEILKNSL